MSLQCKKWSSLDFTIWYSRFLFLLFLSSSSTMLMMMNFSTENSSWIFAVRVYTEQGTTNKSHVVTFYNFFPII